MRDAQDEKQNPERKKNRLRNVRCLFLRSMLSDFAREYLNESVNISELALNYSDINERGLVLPRRLQAIE